MYPNVLIIEDDERLQRIYTDLLEASGCAVMTAECVEDGYKIAAEHRPDVVLLDVQLPNKKGERPEKALGLRLCKAFKSTAVLAGITVLMMTNYYAVDEYKAVALENGADAYLDKPTMWNEIQARLRHMRGKHPGNGGLSA